MFRSGAVGFTLHGSLSHYYYYFCEVGSFSDSFVISVAFDVCNLFIASKADRPILCLQALFPSQDWWVVPAKVLFDQTAWAAIWNSIYYVVLGFLRFESPINIFSELKATFWPMLTVSTLFSLVNVKTKCFLF